MRDIGFDAGAPADGGYVGFSRRARICFLYVAQAHHVPHSISVAVELARGWAGFEVEVAATSAAVLDYAREVVADLGGAPIGWRLLGPSGLRALAPAGGPPPTLPMLAANAHLLGAYDVIVTPERTSAALRRFGVKARLVYTQHGAGDRKGPFEPRLKRFDLVFAAGPKQRDRMVGAGLVAPERCAVVGYPKFDAVALDGEGPRLFADDRPVVLYAPHFHPKLGSWNRWGARILDAFAGQDEFNLIFAPHLRLFEGRAVGPAVRRLVGHPRIHVDLGGSAAGLDMTYTRLADVYLGDASSQVYEFIRTPRPCVFLNPTGADWVGDESFAHFRFGPVLDEPDGVVAAVADALRRRDAYADAQRAGWRATFGEAEMRPSLRAALAISRLAGAAEPASVAEADQVAGAPAAALAESG